MNKNILFNVKILILSLILSPILFAAQGDLDTTFNPAGTPPGTVQTNINNNNDQINSIAIQSDGKIVAGGYTRIGFVSQFALARYNADGLLDLTFGTNGIVVTTIGSDSRINSIAIQSDGKIVAGGTAFIGLGKFALARYNTDGLLDLTFGTNGIVSTTIGSDSRINSIAIQSDGKIVAGGTAFIGLSKFTLARYNTDGLLDITFGTNGIVTTTIGTESVINSIVIQSDGKIVAGGFAFVGIYKFTLARYNIDGSLDLTFGTNGIVTTTIGSRSQINSIALQSDGKIVAGGFETVAGLNKFTLARYNTDGSLDLTFGTNGIVSTVIGSPSTIFSIAMQSDGKIIAGGTSFTGLDKFTLARYNTDGSLDLTFGTNGIVTTTIGINDRINSIAIQSDGKIVAGGQVFNGAITQFAVARYLASSTLIQSLLTIAIKNKYCGNGA